MLKLCVAMSLHELVLFEFVSIFIKTVLKKLQKLFFEIIVKFQNTRPTTGRPACGGPNEII